MTNPCSKIIDNMQHDYSVPLRHLMHLPIFIIDNISCILLYSHEVKSHHVFPLSLIGKHVCMDAYTKLKLVSVLVHWSHQQVSYLALAEMFRNKWSYLQHKWGTELDMIVVTCSGLPQRSFSSHSDVTVFHTTMCVRKSSNKISLIWFHSASLDMKNLHTPSVFSHQFIGCRPWSKEILQYPCMLHSKYFFGLLCSPTFFVFSNDWFVHYTYSMMTCVMHKLIMQDNISPDAFDHHLYVVCGLLPV